MMVPRHTSRHSAALKAAPTQQLITFCLHQEWFALLINAVHKVVPLGNIYGDIHSTGVGLTRYQDKELLVVDVEHRVFGGRLNQVLGNSDRSASQRYLLIVQSAGGELVGIPIDSPPALRRVPESAFTPLPLAYVAESNIQCVSSSMIQTPDGPSLFLLDPERLLTEKIGSAER